MSRGSSYGKRRRSRRSRSRTRTRVRTPIYAAPDRRLTGSGTKLGRPNPRTGMTLEQTFGLVVGAIALALLACAGLAAGSGALARALVSGDSLAITLADTAVISAWLGGAVALIGAALWAVLWSVERAAVALRRRRRLAR